MPKSNNLEAEIKELVSEVTGLPVTKLKTEADLFSELGIDSLKAIEIVAAFERKYRVVVPEKDIPNVRSIKQIAEMAGKLIK
ncbi:MAG: acyl carrier protein [Candidatus Omnitrophota bacterium]|jgi:acyl carrier protein